MSLYDELGVAPDADDDAIKAAWRRKAKETHPDANPDDAAAPANFQRALAAIRNAFTAAVAETADRGRDLWPENLVRAVEQSLRKARAGFDEQKRANEKQQKRWTRLKDRVNGKAFLDVVESQIRIARSNRAAMDSNIAIVARALDMLADGYEHQPDERPAENGPPGIFIITGNWSTDGLGVRRHGFPKRGGGA